MLAPDGRQPDPFRIGKAYTLIQAARLARTTPATVRRWLLGYEAVGHRMTPVFGDKELREASPLRVSFLELVEIIIVASFRRNRRVSLERLRRAHVFARKEWGLDYPFASLDLREFGGHVLHRFEEEEPGPGRLVALDLHGQWVLPGFMQEALTDFEYEDKFACRWFPFGHRVPIVVDPRFAGGKPTITGRGVTIDIIRKRFQAGESIQLIARDFRLKTSVVEEVIRRAA